MTVASETSRSGPYTGNGVTNVFDYGFRILNENHLRVIRTEGGVETVLAIDTDYIVSDVGEPGGGQIALVTPPTASQTITILRDVPFTQDTDLENQGPFFAETVEEGFDAGVMRDQQLAERLDRAVVIPASADPSSLNALVEDVLRLADSADAIDAVANNETNINTVAGISADVATVAGVAGDIPTVAALNGEIVALGPVAPDIPTVAANVDDITNFADVYQGPKAADPTLRNNGSALQAGDLYFNTTVDLMKVRTASGEWADASALSLNMTPNSFTGDGAGTDFVLSAQPGLAGNVLVWVGGVRQVPGTDYTVSGATLTLLAAPGAGVAIDTLVVATVSDMNIPADGSVTAQSISDSPQEQAGILAKIGGPLTPEMFGAIVDAGTSQHVALQAMFDHGGVEIKLPHGRWRSDVDLTCTHDLTLSGPGVLDFSFGTGGLTVSGTMTAKAKMSADTFRGGRALVFASDQGFAPHDIIMLYNPADYSFGSRRAEYRDGGMFEVHSMAGFNPRIYGQCEDAYTASAMDVYKLNPVRVTVDGVGFYEGTASKAPLTLFRCARNSIRNIYGRSETYALVEVDQCFITTIDAGNVENNSPFVGDEYGVEVANSHYTTIRGGTLMATRHAVAIGGYDKVGAVPSRYTKVIGCNLLNQSVDAGAADAHGNADFTTYENCLIANGASVSGRNPRVINCIVYEGTSSGTGLISYSAEYVGGIIEFRGCTFYSQGNGQDYGYIHVNPMGPGNGTNRPVQTNMREDAHVSVVDCKLFTPNAGPLAKAVMVMGFNANKKINVKIDGLEWYAPQGVAFLYCEDSEKALASDYLIVDNVRGPANTYLVYPSNGALAIPTREMTQRGQELITTTAATLNAGGGQAFRYRYSRLPAATAGVSSGNGSSGGAIVGKLAAPQIYSLTTNGIAVGMVSNTAFTAGQSVLLHWAAGVNQV